MKKIIVEIVQAIIIAGLFFGPLFVYIYWLKIMKLVVVFTYGEEYEVGYHNSVIPIEYDSEEQLYLDICSAVEKDQYPVLGGKTIYVSPGDEFDTLKIYTLEKFFENY